MWMIGLVMIVFLFGGIAIDLWRGLAAHRQVAAAVDAAAVAAGSGIDETVWRTEGVVILDPGQVEERVEAAVAAQGGGITVSVLTAEDGGEAVVTGYKTVELTLLRLLSDEGLDVSARAIAIPRLSP